jgi:DNA polymerase
MGKELLAWYQEIGVDETISESSIDKVQTPIAPKPATEKQAAPLHQAPMQKPQSKAVPMPSQPQIVASAKDLVKDVKNLEELRQVMENFDGCALKKTATNLVFGDGNPKSKIMLIGEAPGADEDREGLPFVGQSGKLLANIMTSIGLDRTSYYITNVIPWRPPGNRAPTPLETAMCLPFVEKHIELVNPNVIVMVGATSLKALLDKTDGITKLRGKFFDYQNCYLEKPIKAFAIYHPAYLLRSPGQKRKMWSDMLMLKESDLF